jgi:hypothetical protein
MGEIAMKIGKTYHEADRQYFAGFIAERAQLRPIECHGGLDCWVEFGPPAMTRLKGNTGGAYCAGCGGAPEIPHLQQNRGRPYGR